MIVHFHLCVRETPIKAHVVVKRIGKFVGDRVDDVWAVTRDGNAALRVINGLTSRCIVVFTHVIPWHHLAELGAFEGAAFSLNIVLNLHGVTRFIQLVVDTWGSQRFVLAPLLLGLRVNLLLDRSLKPAASSCIVSWRLL